MTCEHFSEGKEICGKGMPVESLYMRLVCGMSPHKCPLVSAGVGVECASSGTRFAEAL